MNKNQKHLSVLMVTNVFFPVVGGISTYIRDLSEELEKAGVEVKIIAFPVALSQIPRVFRWLWYAVFIGRILMTVAGMRLHGKKPIVHSHSASFCLAAGVAARWLFGCKAVHTFHSPLGRRSWILSNLTPYLSKVVYVSNATRELYKNHAVPVHESESIISGGIQVSQFPEPDFNLRDSISPPRILFVGRICEEKGVREGIEAVGLMKNESILEIVGTAQTQKQNDYLNTLKRIVADSDTFKHRVRFTGMLTGVKLVEAYARAFIFICPSIWEEPAPMVIPEAMAAGLPIIAFDTGGLRERVRTGEDGLLIPKGDVKAFAEALDNLLTDKIRLKKMSRMAREHADTEFDRSIMSHRYIGIYTAQ